MGCGLHPIPAPLSLCWFRALCYRYRRYFALVLPPKVTRSWNLSIKFGVMSSAFTQLSLKFSPGCFLQRTKYCRPSPTPFTFLDSIHIVVVFPLTWQCRRQNLLILAFL